MRRLVRGCVILFVFLSFADGQNDIRVPPYITKGPKESNIFRDDSAVTLECKGEGVPAVNYEWKKDGAALNLNVGNIKRGTDGTITIQPTTSLDEGYYQCFVRNQFGTALSVTSHLQKAFLEFTAGTPSVTNLTVKEGEPFHIQAITKRTFPKAFYAWEMAIDTVDKNPSPYAYSKRVQIADNGDLYFAHAKPEDDSSNRIYKSTPYIRYPDVNAGGSYTTYTQHLNVNASGIYTRVTVTRGAQTQMEPTLAFSSEAVTVGLVGEQVSLRCFFSGNPAPDITWRGNALWSDRYTLEKYKSELIIRNIAQSDEGDYTCTGRNSNGSNSHTLQLKVEAKPTLKRLTDGPQNQNITEGGEAIFNCNVEAIPEATVVWLQDGNPINVNAPPRKFSFSNGGKTLAVRGVCRSCEGEDRQSDLTVIQCNASNVHGYAFASGYLNVLAKTRIISAEREEVWVDDNEDKTFDFECDVTFDPSKIPTVQWYRVKEGSGVEEIVHAAPPVLVLKQVEGKPSVTLSITVSSTTKKWTKYDGEYRCVASSGYNEARKVVTVKNYVPPHSIASGVKYRETEIQTVSIAIAVTFTVFCLLFFIFARLRRKRLQRINLENETGPRRRSAEEDSTIPVYDTIQFDDDYSTIDDLSLTPPSPNVVAIQSTYLTTTANVPQCNEFISSYMGIYEEPMDDEQPENADSSQFYNETQKTNQYMGLDEQTTAEYLALYTDLQKSKEPANDILPEDTVSNHHGDKAQTTNEYLRLVDRNSGAYLTLYSDSQQSEKDGRDDYISL